MKWFWRQLDGSTIIIIKIATNYVIRITQECSNNRKFRHSYDDIQHYHLPSNHLKTLHGFYFLSSSSSGLLGVRETEIQKVWHVLHHLQVWIEHWMPDEIDFNGDDDDDDIAYSCPSVHEHTYRLTEWLDFYSTAKILKTIPASLYALTTCTLNVLEFFSFQNCRKLRL